MSDTQEAAHADEAVAAAAPDTQAVEVDERHQGAEAVVEGEEETEETAEAPTPDFPVRPLSKPVLLPSRKATHHPLMDVSLSSKSSAVPSSATEPIRPMLATVVGGENPSLERGFGRLDRAVRRTQILNRYTSKQGFPVFSHIADSEGAEANLSETDKAKAKLNRLESATEPVMMSQVELIKHVEVLDNELKAAWERGEKVIALRLAIQASKLIGHTKAPHCYPSIFILVASVLDSFGDLVYKRLWETTVQHSPVGDVWTAKGREIETTMIPPEAVETCTNWFLKIASIRELLPRIYIELSLLRCYKFMSNKVDVDYAAIVRRLACQIRGVADPLVAAHVRFYLCLRAAHVMTGPPLANELKTCVMDWFLTRRQMSGSAFEKFLMVHSMSFQQAYDLHAAAFQWMLDSVTVHGDDGPEFLDTVLTEYEANSSSSGSILRVILASFPADAIAAHYERILEFIQEADSTGVAPLELLEVFGLALSEVQLSDRMPRGKRVALLNKVWGTCVYYIEGDADAEPAAPTEGDEPAKKKKKEVTIEQLIQYLRVCGAWLRFCAVNMTGTKEISTLLKDIRKRISRLAPQATGYESALFVALRGLSVHISSASRVLSSEHFLSLLDQVAIADKPKLSRLLLHKLSRETIVDGDDAGEGILDSGMITTTLELCRVVHDALPPVPTAAELESASDTICSALRVARHDDPQSQLTFLSDCRRTLPRLDTVRVFCVYEAVRLVRSVGRHARAAKSHNKRAGLVVKACLAWCHITAPAIVHPIKRLRILHMVALVAFQHNFLAQGEALLLACTAALKEMPVQITSREGIVEPLEAPLLETVHNIIASAAAVPGHPKYGPFYLLDAVSKWNSQFDWPNGEHSKAVVALALFRTSCCLLQGSVEYTFPPPCLTNEELYAGDDRYKQSLLQLATSSLDDAVLACHHLLAVPQPLQGGLLTVEVIGAIVCKCDLAKPEASSAVLALKGLQGRLFSVMAAAPQLAKEFAVMNAWMQQCHPDAIPIMFNT